MSVNDIPDLGLYFTNGYLHMNKVYNPSDTDAWRTLQELASKHCDDYILDYFDGDNERVDHYSIDLEGLYADLSKHLVNDEIRSHLQQLAEQSPLFKRRDAMFAGEIVNNTENRAALHTALRDPDFDNEDIATLIVKQLQQMSDVADKIRTGKWLGVNGDPIKHIVSIGIGGSDLGPKMALEALREFADTELSFHFISNVDGEPLKTLLGTLDPGNTLFIISSKSFTTQETMLNTNTAITWFKQQTNIAEPLGTPNFVAITSSHDTALNLGIPEPQILSFADWVGGRYSLWSAIGLSVCIAIGPTRFHELLAGAEQMDEHFMHAPIQENLPIQLALIGIWYNNFLNAESLAVIPYCERLTFLPDFLQQLDMESNGKQTTIAGNLTDFDTGPIVWGQTGTNGQHAFFQLLHQGTRLIPVDFIGVVSDTMSDDTHHRTLLASMLAQSAALLTGEDNEQPHQQYPGNNPSTTILLDTLTPYHLGMLLALYEHKVFCQGAIWNINSFDQWGVELGKRITTELLSNPENPQLDPSTKELLKRTNLD